ncbi:hypothetical protein DY000_02052150 [Brassica cretica]|uniref:Secreted protein n=1 Tax=Brassica cretica TaxID=69181 RepID=A0ABQ7AMW8_BRACR|nr:hypothetical protein DY000_02052150 [Brassica cretica]
MGVCLSFAFVLSHVDTVLLSSDFVSSSVSGFHLKPHDELLEPHLLLLVLQAEKGGGDNDRLSNNNTGG